MFSKKITNISEIRQLQLDVLIELDAICKKENLRYSLARGTLIGAVKYSGFIPWDDDIDIMMPRPDYEQLIKYCENNTNDIFELYSIDTHMDYGYLFGKACHKNTVLIEYDDKYSRCHLGVCVDIFPVDGVGNDYKKASKRLNKIEVDKALLFYSYIKNFNQYLVETNSSFFLYPIKYMMFFISKVLNRSKLEKRINKRYSQYSFYNSKYCACISRNSSSNEIYEVSNFFDMKELYFEKHKFSVINNYEIYLKNIYGNIDIEPPKVLQVPHHNFEAYYRN